MSDRRYYHLLRSHALHVALACTLAACLGGCSTLTMSDLIAFGAPQASCRTDEWPTQVMGSVQRAKTKSDMPAPVVKERSERVAAYTSERGAEESFEPVAKVEPLAENSSVSTPAAETKPGAMPPAATSPQPQHDVIARAQQPAAPPRLPPSPEVVEVCGANDEACQDQLMTLLADPMHKWIDAKPTPRDNRTGVRILAYRVLTPVLACDDLRKGLREASRAPAADSGTTEGAEETGKTSEWVQLMRRSVILELKSEIEKRC